MMPFFSGILLAMLCATPTAGRITDRYFADPYVFQEGTYYYVFGTVEDGQPPCFFRTKTFAPRDLQWFDLDLDLGPLRQAVAGVWGFTPYRAENGTYHGYGTLHFGWFRTVVAHFLPQDGACWTPEKPITRWRFNRVLVGSRAEERFAYESKVVRDKDGALYLVYSAGYPEEKVGVDIHIMARRMLDPATLDPDSPARPLLSPAGLRSEDRNPGGVQIMEGANLFRRNGRFFLLYSVGDYMLGNYKVGLAWSDTLIPGPGETYRKILQADPDNLWGNDRPGKEVRYLLQTQYRAWPNFAGNLLDGPGLANLVRVAGRDCLVIHAHPRATDGRHDPMRHPWLIPLRMPVLSGDDPAGWLQPILKP